MLEAAKDTPDFLVAALRYIYSEYGPLERSDLRRTLERLVPGKEDEMMSKAGMEIAQEAFAKGREEERAELLLRLIERRFQPAPAEVRSRIARASKAEFDRWFSRILDARSLEELFSEP
jgi:hypothetical protein